MILVSEDQVFSFEPDELLCALLQLLGVCT